MNISLRGKLQNFYLERFNQDESIFGFDFSGSADKLVQSFYRLLSSSVFHNAGTSVLIQEIQSLSSYARRQAFVSLFLSGFFTEAFTFTMHIRIRLTSWAVSPVIVGFPLPNFSLEFVSKLAEDEKLHIDVREVAKKNSPLHTTELFAVLDTTVTHARDALTPTCIWTIRGDLVQSLTAQSPAFAQLLPAEHNPIKFSALPGITIEFPTNE
jgi:hypothetical protein